MWLANLNGSFIPDENVGGSWPATLSLGAIMLYTCIYKNCVVPVLVSVPVSPPVLVLVLVPVVSVPVPGPVPVPVPTPVKAPT